MPVKQNCYLLAAAKGLHSSFPSLRLASVNKLSKVWARPSSDGDGILLLLAAHRISTPHYSHFPPFFPTLLQHAVCLGAQKE